MPTISSLNQSNLIRNQVASLRDRIDELQLQITSGEKAQKYGALGPFASLDINLRNKAEHTDALKASLAFVTIRTSVADTALNAAHDGALSVRDLALKNLGSDTGRQSVIQAALASIASVTHKF